MKLAIEVNLEYTLQAPTDVLLQIEAAATPGQTIEHADIQLPHAQYVSRVSGHSNVGNRIWLHAHGQFDVHYQAITTLNRPPIDIAALPAAAPRTLPTEAIEYILPSRYCPSDAFHDVVSVEFSGLKGGARILAMRDWIKQRLTYEHGNSTCKTTALDTFTSGKGVCRDYAHVMIAMARASDIPARFASVYGLSVKPQDFHAVAEVYLNDAWYLVDPTSMSSAEEMVKIGVGRDAADVAFLTSFGSAAFRAQSVHVSLA